jgi:hypothetical protein
MTEKRRPVHLAMLVGLSASAYAGSLAVVTMLQSTTDAALAAERAPIREIADAITAGHDDLETTVAGAARRYGQVTDRYGALLPELGQAEQSLDSLAKTTSSVTDSALTLPSHVSLPAVPTVARIVRVAAPTTHATTGASGR